MNIEGTLIKFDCPLLKPLWDAAVARMRENFWNATEAREGGRRQAFYEAIEARKDIEYSGV